MKKISRNNLRLHRKKRIRAKISGTSKKPRLAVFKSNKKMLAQIIDDEKNKVLVMIDSIKIKVPNTVGGAEKLGEAIGKEAKNKKITEVLFDRSGYKYHGKVKALAEGTRRSGLKF